EPEAPPAPREPEAPAIPTEPVIAPPHAPEPHEALAIPLGLDPLDLLDGVELREEQVAPQITAAPSALSTDSSPQGLLPVTNEVPPSPGVLNRLLHSIVEEANLHWL